MQEFQMKMESLQQRREELERKEFQLKESLLKFDKFLKVGYSTGCYIFTVFRYSVMSYENFTIIHYILIELDVFSICDMS